MIARLRVLLAILVLLSAAWPAVADTPAGPKFSGQLLDVRNGFVYFTTGDGYRLGADAKIVDAKTGGPPATPPRVKMYARVTFNPANGQIVLLELSATKLPPEAPFEAIHQYALLSSARTDNPDLRDNGATRLTGRPVAVVFTVEVPPKTPIGDAVYMTTDQSNWDAQAIRMDRVDALHYRIQRNFASGTRLLYLYTRGSWNTVERGANGLSMQPRVFNVRETDTLNKGDAVAIWADQNLSAPDLGPNSEPTPFNLNPFPFVTPSPTPRPR
jgi:hypothetical protein